MVEPFLPCVFCRYNAGIEGPMDSPLGCFSTVCTSPGMLCNWEPAEKSCNFLVPLDGKLELPIDGPVNIWNCPYFESVFKVTKTRVDWSRYEKVD